MTIKIDSKYEKPISNGEKIHSIGAKALKFNDISYFGEGIHGKAQIQLKQL